MANAMREISNICRFCLSQDDLIPVSEATASVFTMEHIEYFSGIQMTEDERLAYAMCDRCCNVLKGSVAFHRACLDNDCIFKQLFSVLIDSVKADFERYESATSISNESQTGETESQFDENDNDDSISTCPSPRNSTHYGKVKRKENMSNVTNDLFQKEGVTNCTPPNDAIRQKNRLRNRQKDLCVTCGKLVSNISYHAMQHSDKRRYACTHCPVKMKNPANLQRHIEAVHMKKIILSCKLCDKGFTHKNSYLAHMYHGHGIGETFECKICPKTFKLAHAYRTHMRLKHRPPRDYTCVTCNMVFLKKRALNIHQRVHSTNQPYACNQCPKRFKSSYARNTHELTHTGIRFSCTLCARSYRYKSLLNMHYRKDHTGMTPLKVEDD